MSGDIKLVLPSLSIGLSDDTLYILWLDENYKERMFPVRVTHKESLGELYQAIECAVRVNNTTGEMIGSIDTLRADLEALRKLFKESTDLNTALALRVSQGSAKLTDTWSKLEAVKEELADTRSKLEAAEKEGERHFDLYIRYSGELGIANEIIKYLVVEHDQGEVSNYNAIGEARHWLKHGKTIGHFESKQIKTQLASATEVIRFYEKNCTLCYVVEDESMEMVAADRGDKARKWLEDNDPQ